MHIYKFLIKTLTIASTCFETNTILRELHRSLLKSCLKKHSLTNFLILTWCSGSLCYCVSRTLLRMRLIMCVMCYAAWDSIRECLQGLTRLACSLCYYSYQLIIPWIHLNTISTFFCFLRGIINLNRQPFLWPPCLYFISCTYLVREFIVFTLFIS